MKILPLYSLYCGFQAWQLKVVSSVTINLCLKLKVHILITIVDSIMGSGKTTFMIDYLNQAHACAVAQSFDDDEPSPPKFIYVTPSLDEVQRITKACPGLGFVEPQLQGGRKLRHLEVLIDRGENISTTHALFKNMTKAICRKIKAKGYTLVIDEALECVALFDDLTPSDRQLLLDRDMIYVEPASSKLRWNSESHKDYRGEFDQIKALCDNGNLVLINDHVLIWEFPSEFIGSFDDVFILTYLFRGSPMDSYLKAEGMDYRLKTLKGQQLVSYADGQVQSEVKERLKGLIKIYEGSSNDIGRSANKGQPLSVSWFNNMSKKKGYLGALKRSTEYFFKSVAETPSFDNAWTTFSCAKAVLRGKGYTKGFIPCNAKSTNNYKHKKSLAYLCNRFPNPFIEAYFRNRGMPMDPDAFALSEMLQWIWRSQIREGKPITVFIPSERMRRLFTDWLLDRRALGESKQGDDNIEAVAA